MRDAGEVAIASHTDRFENLVQAYRARVYGYLVRCGIPDDTREDLFQDIFLKVHKALPIYPETQPIEPWLFTIVANTVRSHIRKQKIRSIITHSDEEIQKTASSAPSSEDLTQARQTARRLEVALLTLPLPEKEAILLVCVQGMKIAHAAEALGIPEGTLKTQLRRGRLALAKAIQQKPAAPLKKVSP